MTLRIRIVNQGGQIWVSAGGQFSVDIYTRHIALGLLQQEKTVKRGIKAKIFKAALSADYLTKILTVN